MKIMYKPDKGMGRAMRLFALALLLALAGANLAQAQEFAPLPGLHFFADGHPAKIGVSLRDAESVLLPVAETVPVLLPGAHLEAKPGDTTARIIAGKTILILPVETPNTAGTALESPVAYLGETAIPIADPALWVGDSKSPGGMRLMMDLQVLTGMLGGTSVESDENVYLTTAGSWRGALGLPPLDGEKMLAQVALHPHLGISPPGRKTFLLWVRPQEESVVQVYSLGYSGAGDAPQAAAQPLLGVDNFGDHTLLPTPETGHTEAWAANGEKPVRIETEYGESDAGRQALFGRDGADARYAAYAVIVSRKPAPKGDLLAAIRGGLAPADYCVLGVRQRIGRAFVLYDSLTAAAGDTPAKLAEEAKLPVSVFCSLNGLRPTDRLPAGAFVVYPRAPDDAALAESRRAQNLPEKPAELLPVALGGTEQKPEPQATVAVVVEPDETIAALAAKLKQKPAVLRAANDLAPGEEITPGKLIQLPQKAAAALPAKRLNWKPVEGVFLTSIALNLYASPTPSASVLKRLPKGARLQCIAQEESIKRSEVFFGDTEGFVVTGALAPDDGKSAPAPPRPNAPSAPAPVQSARPAPPVDLRMASDTGRRVVLEALRWVGVPRYVWGGNDIGKGIDCSHFVAAVFKRVGVPCPEPPVHNIEQFGLLTDWKPGWAEDGGKVRLMPAGYNFKYLRPGDRVIMQMNPESRRDGNHHIGIYVGQYGSIAHAVVHCNSSRKTVSVDDIGRLWRIYRYAVRGTNVRPPYAGQTALNRGSR